MPETAKAAQALCLVSTLEERPRGPCSRSQFLRIARCAPAGLARTVVQGYAMHTIHKPSDAMQGAHLAGASSLPASGTAQVSIGKVRNQLKTRLILDNPISIPCSPTRRRGKEDSLSFRRATRLLRLFCRHLRSCRL